MNSAWTYREERGQYYLHQYLQEQPDLNYRSPAVFDEMINVLKFWLDLGVDGFRQDTVSNRKKEHEYYKYFVREKRLLKSCNTKSQLEFRLGIEPGRRRSLERRAS